MTELYHKDVYMPENFISQAKIHQRSIKKICFSYHLRQHISNPDLKHKISQDKLISCIKNLVLNPIKPFEIEVQENNLIKYVVRLPYNDYQDVSIVILCRNMHNDYPLIKTAWLNHKFDNHYTLNKNKYMYYQNH